MGLRAITALRLTLISALTCSWITVLLSVPPKSGPEDDGIAAALAQWRTEYGGGWWPWGLAVLDHDGDGDGDICVTQHNGGSRILRNTGGVFQWADVGSSLGGTFRPRVWDFDGDGRLDLAFRSDTPNTFYRNTGGRFEPLGFAYGTGNYPITYVGDANGDGGTDFGHDWSRWLWDGAGYVWQDYYNPDWDALPTSVQVFILAEWDKPENRFLQVWFSYADLTGDGEPEVLISGYGHYGGSRFVRALTRRADSSLRDDTAAYGLPPTGGAAVYVGDLNGDGRDDVALSGMGLYLSRRGLPHARASGHANDMLAGVGTWPHEVLRTPDWLIINDPRGRTTAVYGPDLGLLEEIGSWDGESIATGDIDGDGVLDLAVGSGGTVLIYYGSARDRDTP